MTSAWGRPDPDPPVGLSSRFGDDLVGLDPDDPEARALAAHLDRMETARPTFTVEGELRGVRDFADSANRAGGLRRWVAVLLCALVLLSVAGLVLDVLGLVVRALLD